MSEAVEESGSLSEHEAQFYKSGQEHPTEVVETTPAVDLHTEEAPTPPEEPEETEPQKAERTRDESGKFTKHRAQSQKASPEDAPRIKELTKNWREEQSKRQELEARLARYESSTRDAASGSNGRQEQPAHSSTSAFTEPEPKIEQFEKETDPYAAYMRALARYDRKKEAFEADQQRIAGERQRLESDGRNYLAQKSNEYATKAAEFSASHPDFNELIAQYDWDLPPLAGAVILEHENGPQLVYNLLKKPDELAGLILLTEGKTVNEKTVALATRWLENRALDAKTGSPAPVVQRKPTPTPPNPVRTVPSGSADSDNDLESMSLSSFEQKFHKRRR